MSSRLRVNKCSESESVGGRRGKKGEEREEGRREKEEGRRKKEEERGKKEDRKQKAAERRLSCNEKRPADGALATSWLRQPYRLQAHYRQAFTS
ncbi:hypothetical protein [Halomonas huangheensis]|uniref:hypothetical protein n=1 Tax=Halomonas huangheensis TaxID=1178482 RepID=UPI0012DEBC61|nr:hypothetical protein [Halomonas huangheensis]